MKYDISTNMIIVLAVLAVWEIIWKGFALWRAAHKGHKAWFIALLVINSVGILPIIYLQLTNVKKVPKHEKTYSVEG